MLNAYGFLGSRSKLMTKCCRENLELVVERERRGYSIGRIGIFASDVPKRGGTSSAGKVRDRAARYKIPAQLVSISEEVGDCS
jgi:hypothetical protein